jgi:tRNA-dependent cyclodipeptide synthase
MSSYRIGVTGAPGWNEKPVCSLEISIGNPRQTGDKLLAAIAWAESHFGHVIFHIGDSLYRHNLEAEGLPPAAARARAMANAETWMAENRDLLDSCRVSHEIIRWDHWLTHPDYPALNSAIRDYYLSDEEFRRAVMADVWTFLERNQERVQIFGPEKIISGCIAFLLEEAAGDTLLSRTYDIARVYPAPQLLTFQHLARPDTPAAVAGLGRDIFTRIALKKRRSARKDDDASHIAA